MVQSSQVLYLEQPVLEFDLNKQGKPSKKFRVVGQEAVKASELARLPEIQWETLTLRPTERGMLTDDFASYPVWILSSKGIICQETLLLKRETKKIRYSLTNAPSDTLLLTLAQRKPF